MNQGFYAYADRMPQILLQVFAMLAMLFLCWRYKKNSLYLFLIVLCFPRVFEFFDLGNAYKVVMLVWCLYEFIKRRAYQTFAQRDIWWMVVFALFIVQFLIATYLYSNNTTLIRYSQLARYVETFLLFFIARDAVFKKGEYDKLLKVLYDIFLMNIWISVVKWLLFWRQIEGLVGSFTIIGGGHGTTVPIAGFIVLWLYRRGRFTWKDWLYILGLLWIGFTTGKRAIMFILPVVVAAFMIYVRGLKINKMWWLAFLAVPVLLYLGVRLTPTLNPEGQVWGSFDWDYAMGYAEEYQFGKEGIQGQREILAQEEQIAFYGGGYHAAGKQIEAEGRGGTTIALLKLAFGPRQLTDQDLWGTGFKNMYGIDYAEFDKLPLTIHANHKGSATGFFQSYVTTGILGAVCTILFCFFPLFFYSRNRRMTIALVGICAWDYFMYSGLLFRTPVLMVAFFLAILSTYQKTE